MSAGIAKQFLTSALRHAEPFLQPAFTRVLRHVRARKVCEKVRDEVLPTCVTQMVQQGRERVYVNQKKEEKKEAGGRCVIQNAYAQ